MYTGYWIDDNWIWGLYNSGKYWIEDKFIWGPRYGGKFWIEDGYIYGPSKTPPWLIR